MSEEDAGDVLAGPAHWPRAVGFADRPYEWPYPNATIVHGPAALSELEHVDAEVGRAPAGPQTVKIQHEPKHSKNPPWLTWGNSKNIEVVGIPLAASISDYVQLVNVRYGRPETWRFFLAATLLQTSDNNPPPVAVTVEFLTTIGNGFTSFTAPFFQTFEFPAGGGSAIGDVLMCTQVQQRKPNTFFDAANPAPNVLELIPAQDLYIAARIVTEGSIGAGIGLTMSATAMVAPNVHVRPGWHLDIFAGGEERF